jgi:hypothetical protein
VDTGSTKWGALIIWGPLQFWFAFWFQARKARAIDKAPRLKDEHQHRLFGGLLWFLVCDKLTTSSHHLGAEKGFCQNGEFLVKGLAEEGMNEWIGGAWE